MRADASLAQNPTRVDPLQGANAQLATAAERALSKPSASPKPETTALKSRARAVNAAADADTADTPQASAQDKDRTEHTNHSTESVLLAQAPQPTEANEPPSSGTGADSTPAAAPVLSAASNKGEGTSAPLLPAAPSFAGLLLAGGGIALAAGSSSSSGNPNGNGSSIEGFLIDSPVGRVDYYINGVLKGKTSSNGGFNYTQGDKVTFKIGNITLGENIDPATDKKVYLQDLAGVSRDNLTDPKVVKLAQLLQTLDADKSPSNGIQVDIGLLADTNTPLTVSGDTDLAVLVKPGVTLVSESAAIAHAKQNNPATQNLESTPPTLTITDSVASGAATGAVTYTFTFSEAVTGFSADDVTVTNGSKGAFTAATGADAGKVFTLVVTPTANAQGADIGVSVGNAFADLAGNAPAAATQAAPAQSYDTQKPTLAITDSVASGAANGPVTYTFTFSEAVTGFSADDVTVTNGSKGTFTAATGVDAGKVFTLVVTPTANAQGADIGVSVGNAWTDLAANAPAAATQAAAAQSYDTQKPTLSITDSMESGAATGAVTYTFTFSEAVTGFSADDVTVTNGSKGLFTPTTTGADAGKVFTLVVTPTADAQGADIGVSVGNAFADLAGNAPAAATQAAPAQSYDTQKPTLAITDSVASGAANGPVTYTFTFSEAVTGFSADDVTVTNGSKGTFTAATGVDAGKVFTLVVTPTANAQGADIGVSVGDAWADLAGNTPLANATLAAMQSYDTKPPIAVLKTVGELQTVQLEPPSNTTNDDNAPQKITAVGSAGEYVVTWYGTDSQGDYSIFVQKFNANGSTSGSAVQLEALNNSTGSDYFPQITAVGSTGKFVVTWYGDTRQYDYSVYVQSFNADGSVSGNTVELQAPNQAYNDNNSPQITAVGSAGEYVVTWYGWDSTNDYSIFVQKFNADGSTNGSTVQLEALNKTNGFDEMPQISAVGSAGEYVVTWYGWDSTNDYSIFVQKFNANGSTSGSTVQLEALNKTNGYDSEQQITAVGSAGEYVVTWQGQDSQGDFSIFVQKFNADGSTSGSTVQLEALNKTNGNDQFPQISAVGSAGEYVVTWWGTDSQGDNSIFVQKFNADGSTSGSTVQLEAQGTNSRGWDGPSQITAVGSTGEYVVTWYGQDSQGDGSIFVQKFNADGSTSGSTVQLEALGNSTGQDYTPQITAVGSAGEYVVTWQGQDSQRVNSIFVQKFNADGTPLAGPGPAVNVNASTPGTTVPVSSSEAGKAWLVHSSIDMSTGLAALINDNASKWKSTDIASANTVVQMASTDLIEGEYRLYTSDAWGNVSAPVNKVLVIDKTLPTLTITDSVESGAATGAVTYTFTFSEAVTGFTADDVTVTNGSKGLFTPTTTGADAGKVFTLVVTPTANAQGADIGVSVGNAWTDLAANAPAAATQAAAAQSYDTQKPTLTISDSVASGAANGPVTYTFTFSEAVTGFSADDVTVTNGSKGLFTPTTTGADAGKVFTLVVTPTADAQGADIGVSVGNAFADLAGNAPAAATQAAAAQSYDTQKPTLAITDSVASGAANGPVTYTFTFSETVTDFTADDVTVTNGSKGTFTAATGADAGKVFTLVVTPTLDAQGADIGVSVGNAFADLVGNAPAAATQTAAAQSYDTQKPTLTIADSVASGAATGAVTYTFTFSEAVTGFTTDDVTVTNGSKGAFTAATGADAGKVFTLVVTPTLDAQGADIGVSVGDAWTDLAGNAPAAATQAADAQSYNTQLPQTIDLGAFGQLILPVRVDGQAFYALDVNKDGQHDGADRVSHDVLDAVFKFAADFTSLRPGNDTDNTYRFATVNGVKVALPTLGHGQNGYHGDGGFNGTSVDNSPPGQLNPTYDDMLAIWDAHNGNGTESITYGSPAGWASNGEWYGYWTATPYTFAGAYAHAVASLLSGRGTAWPDDWATYNTVALQLVL